MVNGTGRTGIVRGIVGGQQQLASRQLQRQQEDAQRAQRAQQLLLQQQAQAKAQAEARAEAKRQAELARQQATVTVGGQQFSVAEFESQFNKITSRISEGRGLGPSASAQETALTRAILRDSPEIREALESITVAKQQARKFGFGKDVQEFLSVSGRVRKQAAKIQQQKFVPAAQRGAIVSPAVLGDLQQRAAKGSRTAQRSLERVTATAQLRKSTPSTTTIGGTPSFLARLKEGRPVRAITEFAGQAPFSLERRLKERTERAKKEFARTATPAQVRAAKKAEEKFIFKEPGFTTEETREEAARAVFSTSPFLVGGFVTASLLVGSAAESFFTKAGRKELDQLEASLKGKEVFGGRVKIGDRTAFFLSRGAPGLEAVLGGLGIAPKVITGVGLAATRFSPKFKPVTELGPGVRGLKGIKGQGEVFDLPFAGTVKKIAEPVNVQLALEGKTVRGVSAQTGFLKPFQGEKGLSRPFFVDPRGRLRVSRIVGTDAKEASFIDLVRGRAALLPGRSQGFVFQEAIIAKFPNRLRPIVNKLKNKQTLTTEENKALNEFIFETPTGKFKPLGFLSTEPEIIASTGEIIRKQQLLARTIVEGKPVDVIGAQLGRASPELRALLKKKSLSKAELKRAATLLSKESGLSRSTILQSKPFFNLSRLSRPGAIVSRVRATRLLVSGKVFTKKVVSPFSKPSKIKTSRGVTLGGISRLPPAKSLLGKPSAVRRVSGTGKISRVTPTLPRKTIGGGTPFFKRRTPSPLGLKKKKVVRKRVGYNAFARQKGKFIKLNKRPLTKVQAKNLASFIVDNSTSARGRVRKAKGVIKKPRVKIPAGYFSQTQKKYRAFKIQKGKKKPLVNDFIERRRSRIDTRGEKKGLSVARALATIRPKRVKKRRR